MSPPPLGALGGLEDGMMGEVSGRDGGGGAVVMEDPPVGEFTVQCSHCRESTEPGFVVSDDHAGLKKALTEVLTDAAWQRCYVHFRPLPPQCAG